jgi:hypothetical protein
MWLRAVFNEHLQPGQLCAEARQIRGAAKLPSQARHPACQQPHQEPNTMGLPERRKVKELQEATLPERSREIAEICGEPVPYEVDWASIENDAQALNFIDNLSCHRLNMALRVICQDEMGKQAVREGLKRVRLKNVAEPSQRHLAFAGGVLEMHCAYAQGIAGMHSDSAIREVLLAAL